MVRPFLSLLFFGIVVTNYPGMVRANALKAIETEISRIVERASAFVVSISAETLLEQDGCRHRNIGSGVLIDSTGHILTTADVIKDAEQIHVTTADGDTYVARLFASDPESKLVLLKTAPQKTSYATLADSDCLRVGQWAITLGNSMGVAPTVSIGLISGFQGNNRLIQITSFTFPGNSGAPVLNSDGQVIGIVTAAIAPPLHTPMNWPTDRPYSLDPFGTSTSPSAIMLAVPANRTREITTRLLAKGSKTYGWLGITAQELRVRSPDRLEKAIRVVEVIPGSPAENASIKIDDIILKYDGESTESIRALVKLVRGTSINKRVKVRVERAGQEVDISVTVGICPQRPYMSSQQR